MKRNNDENKNINSAVEGVIAFRQKLKMIMMFTL